MTLQSGIGNVNVSLRNDNNGVPGDLVSELAEWNVILDPLSQTGYNLIVTTDLCIYLDANNIYWWTIQAGDDITEAKWAYSNGIFYQYASSHDSGENWAPDVGPAGAGGIWAEQIYETPYEMGDVNFDFSTNVF